MADSLTVALAQTNPTVGGLTGNLEAVRRVRGGGAARADLAVFGELAVSGYPPEDLVLKPAFMDALEAAVADLARETADGGPAVLIGAPWRADGGLYNAALLLDGGEIAHVRLKHDLPNYRVFDEKRVFAPGPLPDPMPFRGAQLGVMICEDMWTPGVSKHLHKCGAEILISINGSPFEQDKAERRVTHAAARVKETGLPLACLNITGGQDELVFDGASFVLNADGDFAARLPSMREDVILTRWTRGAEGWTCAPGETAAPPKGEEAVYQALVLGLRDYVRKNDFPGVLLGLSGGIDSALSAAVAVDALGAGAVRCVMMPSPYTSRESLEDARACAEMLGCALDVIPIQPAMDAFTAMLAPAFAGLETGVAPGTTEENVQSRARGVTLMALSNKLGAMVLSTGNKSEMSVGYATLYGDMCGGYSVLKDVYKTEVFRLARWRNAHTDEWFLGPKGAVTPERVITKAPSAELKPDQTDQDTLPPYETLDAVLQGLIEGEKSVDELAAEGHTPQLVMRIWAMLDRAEYKRRQAPPGVKITSRAFGRDRRYPVTNRFRGTP
ncbi:MAG: NAD+ synthase [Rhodospirillales bacterium]